MEKKFTKGEWIIGQNNFCIDILCNDKVLATCWGTVKVRSERIANAKLIAAAPELLDACIEALKHHQGAHSEIGHKLRETIKKATE